MRTPFGICSLGCHSEQPLVGTSEIQEDAPVKVSAEVVLSGTSSWQLVHRRAKAYQHCQYVGGAGEQALCHNLVQ